MAGLYRDAGRVSLETQLYRDIMEAAGTLSGQPHSRVSMGCNFVYGYWTATVAVLPPRRKGRFLSAQGDSPRTALHNLSNAVAVMRRDAGLLS